jgi:hypothetical protein
MFRRFDGKVATHPEEPATGDKCRQVLQQAAGSSLKKALLFVQVGQLAL